MIVSLRRDLPDVAAGELREPEVAVRPRADVPGKRLLGGERKFRLVGGVAGIEPNDVVPDLLGEPDVSVRPGRDERRKLADPARVLVDRPVLRDAADLVDVLLGEPEIAVGKSRDVPGLRVRSRERVLGDLALRRDLPDLVAEALGEPQVAVRADRDPVRPAVLPLERKLGDRPAGVMRPIVPRMDSVNQRFPSGPATIVYGRLSACGSGNSVTSANATGTRKSARPTPTSIETIHRFRMFSPPGDEAECTARRPEFLVRVTSRRGRGARARRSSPLRAGRAP